MARTAFAALIAVVAAACGDSPAAPTPRPTAIIVTGLAPAVGSTSQLTAVVTMSDGTQAPITSTAAWATSNALVATVTATGVLNGVGPGVVDVRATHQGLTGSLTLTVTGADTSPFARDYLESLMLGSGPLTPRDGLYACPWRGRWSAFPRGTTVRLLISTTITAPIRSAIEHAVEAVTFTTNGDLTVVIESTADPNPMPGTNEATVTTHPTPASQGCGSNIGCTFPFYSAPGVLRASRALLPPNQTINAYVHDIVGHGLMGLCHVDGFNIGGPRLSLMSGGPGVFSNDIALELTTMDVAAARSVYLSPLSPGAVRTDFVSAFLLGSSAADLFGRPAVAPGPDRIESLPVRGR